MMKSLCSTSIRACSTLRRRPATRSQDPSSLKMDPANKSRDDGGAADRHSEAQCRPERSEESPRIGSVRAEGDSSTTLGMTGSARLHSFDAMRAMLAIFGVILHAYYFYLIFSVHVGSFENAILTTHSKGSQFFILLSLWIHSFRMPAFFALSGFFSYYLLTRIGRNRTIKNRCQRILIPFLVLWLVPLLYTGAKLFLLHATLAEFHQDFNFQEITYVGTFWFLYFLVILDAILLLIFIPIFRKDGSREPVAGRRRSGVANTLPDTASFTQCKVASFTFAAAATQPKIASLISPDTAQATQSGKAPCLASTTAVIPRLVRGIHLSPALVSIGLIFASILCLMISGQWFTPTSISLIPELSTLIYYGLFFAFGCFFASIYPSLSKKYQKSWPLGFLVSILLVGVYWILFSDFHTSYPAKIAAELILGLLAWLMTATLFFLFESVASKPNKIWRYLADSSYWIYIAQMPIITALSLIFFYETKSALITIPSVTLITLGILLLSYQILIRKRRYLNYIDGARS